MSRARHVKPQRRKSRARAEQERDRDELHSAGASKRGTRAAKSPGKVTGKRPRHRLDRRSRRYADGGAVGRAESKPASSSMSDIIRRGEPNPQPRGPVVIVPAGSGSRIWDLLSEFGGSKPAY